MVIYQGCLLLLLFDVINFVLFAFSLVFFMLYTFQSQLNIMELQRCERICTMGQKVEWKTLKMCRKTERFFLRKLIFWWIFLLFNVFYHFKTHQYHRVFLFFFVFSDHFLRCPETNKMIFYTFNSARRNYTFGLFLTLQIIRCRWVFSLHISSVKNLNTLKSFVKNKAHDVTKFVWMNDKLKKCYWTFQIWNANFCLICF